MYRCITELKALAIDIDSFIDTDFSKWSEIVGSYRCLFFTSNGNAQQELAGLYGAQSVFYISEFLTNLAPTPMMHMHALNLLKVHTTELAYVSCSINFLKNALTFYSGTIWITDHISYENISTSPDILCPDFSYFKEYLKTGAGGYFGESIVSGDSGNNRIMVSVALQNTPNIRMRVLGRYYSYSHYMKQKHRYSSAIYLNKNRNSKAFGKFNDVFLRIYKSAIRSIFKNTPIDGICSVPPHLGESNRFHGILEDIAKECNIENMENYFHCTKEYPKQKGRSSTDRPENIFDVFTFDKRLDGKNIVILDDVVTTGSTMKECSRVLYNAGAKNIYPVVLAVNQFPGNYWSSEVPDVLCPYCDSPMKLLVNSKTKAFFYSCPDCGANRNYDIAWQEFCDTVNSQFFETSQEEDPF